jgi:hypothetical protein
MANVSTFNRFTHDIHGLKYAQAIANCIESIWNSDMDFDPFAVQ